MQCVLSFYVFRVITLPTRCITNVITVMVITVIFRNTITASNSMYRPIYFIQNVVATYEMTST